ncbi:hypothetical protein O3M35_003443 [Rhynocoris fuscipes]|uniref:Uncharacterized protein n=1 Tax=Rhynocoris fuscipes TaxID=488301 RepID=A0AAW1CKH1_9HEMI
MSRIPPPDDLGWRQWVSNSLAAASMSRSSSRESTDIPRSSSSTSSTYLRSHQDPSSTYHAYHYFSENTGSRCSLE